MEHFPLVRLLVAATAVAAAGSAGYRNRASVESLDQPGCTLHGAEDYKGVLDRLAVLLLDNFHVLLSLSHDAIFCQNYLLLKLQLLLLVVAKVLLLSAHLLALLDQLLDLEQNAVLAKVLLRKVNAHNLCRIDVFIFFALKDSIFF